MNQCYDLIPILHEGQIQFVDPITRQTQPAANLQNCTNRLKNLFHFDMDQEDSWYTLKPGIVHQDRPAVFGPKDVSPVAVHSFPGSQDARSTLELNSVDFGTVSRSVPPLKKL